MKRSEEEIQAQRRRKINGLGVESAINQESELNNGRNQDSGLNKEKEIRRKITKSKPNNKIWHLRRV